MTTWYVANAGSDGNDGISQATPIKTIGKLNAVIQPGDTALFNRGDTWNTITDAVPIMKAGCAYDAYGAAPQLEGSGFQLSMPGGEPDLHVNDWVSNAPVFDAGETLNGWTAYNGGVSDDYLSDDFSSVTAGADLSTSVPQVQATADKWAEVTDIGGGAMVATAVGRIRRADNVHKAWYWLRGGPNQPPYNDYSVVGTFRVASLLATDVMGVLARMSPSGLGDQYNVQLWVLQDGSWKLSADNAGALTAIASGPAGSVPVAAGDTVEVRIDVLGPTATAYINGAQVGGGGFGNTKVGSFFSAGGAAGVFLGSASSTVQTDTTGFQLVSYVVSPLNDQTAPTVPTYQAPLVADVGLYTLRGQLLTRGQGPNILEDGQVAWLDGVLYIATSGGAPAVGDVVIGGATSIVSGGATDGVTIGGLTLRHSNGSAITWGAAPTSLTIDGTQIELCCSEIVPVSAWGALNVQGASGLTVRNCVFRTIGSDAARLNQCPGHQFEQNRFGPMLGSVANAVIHTGADQAYNAVYRRNWSTFGEQNLTGKGHYVPTGSGYTFDGNYMERGNFGIGLGNGTNSNITTDRNFYYLVGDVTGDHFPGGGFRVADGGSTTYLAITCTRSLFLDCPAGIVVGSQGGGTPRKQLTIENNTIVNIAVPPAAQNPVMLSAGAGYQVNFLSTAAVDGTFKNNVLWNAAGSGKALLVAAITAGQTWASDNNLIGPDGAGNISYTGTVYNTLAAYSAGKTQDAHSISADPAFSNPTGPKDASSFRLTYRSPARDAATPASDTDGSWGPPDIGASEYVVGFWGVPA